MNEFIRLNIKITLSFPHPSFSFFNSANSKNRKKNVLCIRGHLIYVYIGGGEGIETLLTKD